MKKEIEACKKYKECIMKACRRKTAHFNYMGFPEWITGEPERYEKCNYFLIETKRNLFED